MAGLNGRFQQTFQSLLLALMGAILFLLLFYYIFPAVREIIKALVPVVLPFALAGLLAAIIDPVVNFIEKRGKIGRGWAVIATLLLVLAIFSIALFYLIANLIIELESLVMTLPAQARSLGAIMQDYFYRLQSFYFGGNLPPDIFSTLQALLNNGVNVLKNVLTQTAQGLVILVSSLPEFFIFVIITLVATYFCSRDKELILKTLLRVMPAGWRERTSRVCNSLGRAIIGYLRAEILLISLQMTQSVLGLLILKVDYALTLAFLIGVADFLPIVGPGTVFIPWIIIEFILGHYGLGLALLILYAFIIILRQVLQPKLVAVNLGLYPLTTLIALYAGLKLLGVVGLALGPLTIVVLKAFFRSEQGVDK
ncbi:sporulation integral membrane protein YtvI [Moorella sp. Hama-1]|uniref:sporulation integral membrane protein YtvI n=1 Tax=Moorella sp. Hama-1 TaxID=2138101 RepID=UPI000D64CA9A|nr:sporulation integral membrane protein YtvI [Moorella sp. Hama-1]BCV21123.1 sporulation integral membrane protein YtvI [Moorella sp. Hama-1]